jgi:hypothetical protein
MGRAKHRAGRQKDRSLRSMRGLESRKLTTAAGGANFTQCGDVTSWRSCAVMSSKRASATAELYSSMGGHTHTHIYTEHSGPSGSGSGSGRVALLHISLGTLSRS